MKKHHKYLILLGLFVQVLSGISQNVVVDSNDNATTLFSEIENYYLQKLPIKQHQNFKNIFKQQTLINVEYYGFDGHIHSGQIICNQSVSKELSLIFKELLKLEFPIKSVIPISKFDYNDQLSMQANNTTCFDYRLKTLGNGLSKHAIGLAIDINPMQNPYFTAKKTYPAVHQANISKGRIRKNDESSQKVIEIFKKYGWSWGGNWKNSKDYMHFEKVVK